jgi:hypothetical protein
MGCFHGKSQKGTEHHLALNEIGWSSPPSEACWDTLEPEAL